MRKRNIKEELEKYPCYLYEEGKLKRISPPSQWTGLHLHHYIRTQWQQNNPDKFALVEHLQKLIFLPPQMHMELHARHSKFKEKYGLEIDELLFNWKGFDMISAKEAREQSDINRIEKIEKDIEKLIKRAIGKGTKAAFYAGQVPEELEKKMIEKKFVIEKCPTGMRITW